MRRWLFTYRHQRRQAANFDTDPLTERLRELRADLTRLLLNDRNFDAVRKVTDEVGTR